MSASDHPLPRASDGQKVFPEIQRDTDTQKFKKKFQEVKQPAVVGNINDEYYRHPPHNESGLRDKGAWKRRSVTPDPTEPEVPKGLKDAVGEGGMGASLGREKVLEVQIDELNDFGR